MVIRILPSLCNRQEWIDFCSRETSYCYIETPATLVDFQTSILAITLLNDELRNGRQAIKYSIGSAQTIEPAWNFIKGCQFDLGFMVQGLEAIDFSGNARDNFSLGFTPEANIRKFYNKEQSIISPNTVGVLPWLTEAPRHWCFKDLLRLLANQQFTDLRSEQAHLATEQTDSPDAETLLLRLIESPQHWQVRMRNQRLWLIRNATPRFSLLPQLQPITQTALLSGQNALHQE